jgi:hypothetical protein
MHSLRSHIAFFVGIYLLGALGIAISQANIEFLLYVFVVLFLCLLILLIDRHAHFSVGLLWLLAVWGLMHMAGGLTSIPDDWPAHAEGARRILYTFWILPGILKYDQVVHAFGYGTCAWLCYQWFRSKYRTSGPTIGVLILCGLASMGLGSINEVLEFFAQKYIEGTNVGGYENTAWDLIFNMLGVTVAACLIRFWHPAKEKIRGLRFI